MQQEIFERFLQRYSSLFYKHGYSNMRISSTKTASSLAFSLLSKTSKSETLPLGPRHRCYLCSSPFGCSLRSTPLPTLLWLHRRALPSCAARSCPPHTSQRARCRGSRRLSPHSPRRAGAWRPSPGTPPLAHPPAARKRQPAGRASTAGCVPSRATAPAPYLFV